MVYYSNFSCKYLKILCSIDPPWQNFNNEWYQLLTFPVCTQQPQSVGGKNQFLWIGSKKTSWSPTSAGLSNTVQQYYCISQFTSFCHPLQLLFQNFSTFLKLPTSPLSIHSQWMTLPPASHRKWPWHESSLNFLPSNLKSDFVCTLSSSCYNAGNILSKVSSPLMLLIPSSHFLSQVSLTPKFLLDLLVTHLKKTNPVWIPHSPLAS